MSISADLNAWFREHGRALPWRADGFGAWGILVSEFMLQQTPVARVIPRLEEWLGRWPRPSSLAAEPPGEAVRAWGRLGYPRRALRLHAAASAIASEHGDVVPRDVATLESLPGVGAYTARAVAVFAYGDRHPVVDINARRVIARAVHGEGEPGPAQTKRDLADMEALLPADVAEARMTNIAVMELGQVVCTARSPHCEECPIAHACVWRLAGYPEYKGALAPKQRRFEGSDRQVRGLILAELRAADVPVTHAEIARVWTDAAQRERALAGLLVDGLAVGDADAGYTLP